MSKTSLMSWQDFPVDNCTQPYCQLKKEENCWSKSHIDMLCRHKFSSNFNCWTHKEIHVTKLWAVGLNHLHITLHYGNMELLSVSTDDYRICDVGEQGSVEDLLYNFYPALLAYPESWKIWRENSWHNSWFPYRLGLICILGNTT
jgi:hypothetical protein